MFLKKRSRPVMTRTDAKNHYEHPHLIRDERDIRMLTKALPPNSRRVKLRLADIATLRLLALPRPQKILASDLDIELAYWEAPLPRWVGAAAPLSFATGVHLTHDAGKHRASARVVLSSPTSIRKIANALLPAFAPTQPFSGAGFPLLAVAEMAGPLALALLPSRQVPAIRPIPPVLGGEHLRPADVLLSDKERPAERRASTQILLSDIVTAAPRRPDTVIDLTLHNPVGRVLSFKPSPAARRLELDEETKRAHLIAEERPEIEFRLDRPIDARTVRALRNVESIDLSALPASTTADFFPRLAEIAATGAILHSLSDDVTITPDLLAPELSAALRAPYRQCLGLERERRSVLLRRTAMREHGGFFRLADHLRAATGHRFLPRVSVILSSMRPQLIAGALLQMARQNYPDFEVVVLAHGCPAPDLSDHSEALAGLDYTIVEIPGSDMFGAALAEGVRRSSGDYITKLDDDDWYSENHVFDLVLAQLYSQADIVGKTTEYLFFEEYEQTIHRTFATERYHDQMAGGAMLLSRSAFDALGGWRPTPNSTDRSVLLRVHDEGGIGYRTHGLGYLYIRHANTHTWVREASQLLDGSYEQWRGRRLPEVPGLDV